MVPGTLKFELGKTPAGALNEDQSHNLAEASSLFSTSCMAKIPDNTTDYIQATACKNKNPNPCKTAAVSDGCADSMKAGLRGECGLLVFRSRTSFQSGPSNL